MGGGRAHWLKVVGTVAGRQGDERENERKREESGQRSIMAGLTNGRERPQLSSKFNLAAEVDSPFLRFRGSADPIQFELRFSEISWTIKPLIPHSGVAHSPSDNGLADRSYYSPSGGRLISPRHRAVTRVFASFRRSLSKRIR